jgi:flagellar motility protein MotE (MotC chaperone)
MNASRFARLLPAIIALGAAVLVLKSTDLVHEAYGQAAALTANPVPANKDYAGGEDDQVASASEVDVVNSLARRRRELDQRENQLNMQANILAATESRVDTKIAQLKQLQAQISSLINLRDDDQKKQVASLIKTYGPDGMKPAKAAAIFNNLPDDVLIPVTQGMKPGDLGAILAAMNPEAAQRLTVKLANRLSLPQTTDALAPPAPPAPGPVTAALNPATATAAQAAPVSADQPVKKRVRKLAPAADTTASVAPAPASVAQSAAPASPPANAAPQPAAATPAAQETQAQPKT